MTHQHRFTVDMLRYDRCCPDSEADAGRIRHEREVVSLAVHRRMRARIEGRRVCDPVVERHDEKPTGCESDVEHTPDAGAEPAWSSSCVSTGVQLEGGQ